MSRGAFAPSPRRGKICGGFQCRNEKAPGAHLCASCLDRMAQVRKSLDVESESRTYNSRQIPRRSSDDEAIAELLPSVAQPD